MEKGKSLLVIFEDKDWANYSVEYKRYDVIVGNISLKEEASKSCDKFIDIKSLVGEESIYEAQEFAESLAQVDNAEGKILSKSVNFEGYELWWVNFNNLFYYFGLPYSKFKNLLLTFSTYQNITLVSPPSERLFVAFLDSIGVEYDITGNREQISSSLSLGIILQILITVFSLPILAFQRKRRLIFTGDKLAKEKDFDARMEYVYKAWREKELSFVEMIRSFESTSSILQHAIRRRRPVIYSEAIIYIARTIALITGAGRREKRRYGIKSIKSIDAPDQRFKVLIGSQYLFKTAEQIWAIKITNWIYNLIGIHGVFTPAANERNFHAVLGAKLKGIPTVGILHGVASRFYNGYDFLPGFNSNKKLSVDAYGLWSEWWKQYYEKHSDAYTSNQLFVSGPMRPAKKRTNMEKREFISSQVKVLLVSEIVAIPTEITPYIDEILKEEDFTLSIKFRPQNDAFENWLKMERPDILRALGEDGILKGGMDEAIRDSDVVIGSQSTGVIESTLEEKPFVLFNTNKWGDYFDMRSFESDYHFFAENPKELIEFIEESRNIPSNVIIEFREKFFGDPNKNGSRWVVEKLEELIVNNN